MVFARLSVVLSLLCATVARSHEFWIEPEQYQVESGSEIIANLRNGENFNGVALGWFERRFLRFEMVSGEQVFPVEGRMGDTPALQAKAPGEGLLVVLHETTPSTLTYRKWEKFQKFAAHKDLGAAIRIHETEGWPKDLFRESYTRHAKALIAVADGAGSDRAFGMQTEFVALTNPYDDAFGGTMRAKLYYENAPRPDAQVEVFSRAPDGAVETTFHRTDDLGEVAIPVRPGHEYLFDAVVIRPSPQAQTNNKTILWETLWAALTFAVPSDQ